MRRSWRGVLTVLVVMAVAGCSWTTYHRDAGRTGLDPTASSIVPVKPAWLAPLDGMIYAEPLVYRGRVYIATENDSVYALDLGSGQVLWRTHLGTPAPLSVLACAATSTRSASPGHR